MQRYANLSRNSGVDAWECGSGWIIVRFRNGATYRYTDASAGAQQVARMQQLAEAGRGLSSYISRNVAEAFDRKFEAVGE